MDKLVEFLAKGVVSQPENVQVGVVEGQSVNIVELTVHDDDVDRIIGKDGEILRAMRQVLSAAAGRTKTMLELVNTQAQPRSEAGAEE